MVLWACASDDEAHYTQWTRTQYIVHIYSSPASLPVHARWGIFHIQSPPSPPPIHPLTYATLTRIYAILWCLHCTYYRGESRLWCVHVKTHTHHANSTAAGSLVNPRALHCCPQSTTYDPLISVYYIYDPNKITGERDMGHTHALSGAGFLFFSFRFNARFNALSRERESPLVLYTHCLSLSVSIYRK